MKSKTQLKEIKEKDNKALYQELTNLNKKLAQLKFDMAFRKLKNVHTITDTRKEIARIWTIITERAEKQESRGK